MIIVKPVLQVKYNDFVINEQVLPNVLLVLLQITLMEMITNAINNVQVSILELVLMMYCNVKNVSLLAYSVVVKIQ